MKERTETFDADMQALWVGLEGARHPAGMLMTKVKEMKSGVFRGMSGLDREFKDFAQKFFLHFFYFFKNKFL